MFEQAQMQAETSAKYVYNITEDKIALQAEVRIARASLCFTTTSLHSSSNYYPTPTLKNG